MKKYLPLFVLGIFAFSSAAQPKCNSAPVKIAVVDTGFGWHGYGKQVKLCKYGHKDFTVRQEYSTDFGTKTKVPLDRHGHGTNIAGIIDAYAKESGINYCIVIVKFFDPKNTAENNIAASEKALEYVYNIKADMVNYSAGGTEHDAIEALFVKKFLDRGGVFVAAAGNTNSNLDDNNFEYPAMYDDRVVTVGGLDRFGLRMPMSNYGKVVKRWELGENVTANHIRLTGTSQATAIATGKLIRERFRGEGNECIARPQGH
jgi:hypothetical protein